MTKRIMAMLLTVAMIISLGTVAGSAEGTPSTVKEAIYAYGASLGLDVSTWLNREIKVPADVNLREEGSANFVDGPITVSERTTGNISTFDYQATLYMDVVREAFEDYTAAARRVIEASNAANKPALYAELENMPVYGSFTVKIVIPESDFDIPEYIKESGNMVGFNDAAKKIFHEVGRTIVDNVITIEIGVGGTETNNADYATKAELENYLGENLVFTCEGVQPTAFGTYQTKGYITGLTTIGGPAESADKIATITYKTEAMPEIGTVDGNDAPAATLTVRRSSSPSSGGSSGSEKVTVSFIVDGKVIKSVTKTDSVTVTPMDVDPGEKEGYEFIGWYTDPELTVKASDPITVTEDTNLYAKWKFKGEVLNTGDHFAYIIGYEDLLVRPLNNIVREEVATIFFRLLTEEAGEAMHATGQVYSDVAADRWSSTAIATLTKGGYIGGYEDGTFGPQKYITRAEFAAIAARFSDAETEGIADIDFSDISGHWAEKYIKVCAANGWIDGYEDGTFKPDRHITRAEAMAIVNRMLGRAVDEAGIAPVEDSVFKFKDNVEGTWYYYIVLEATNSHDFTRDEGETYETWTEITEVRDWHKYEE